MNVSRLTKGARVKQAELVVGKLYCVTYKHNPDKPCVFAKYRGPTAHVQLFDRVDLPNENSPNFDPHEPPVIGGPWIDLKVYTVVSEDPAEANNPGDPTAGGARSRKNRKTRKGSRRATTRKNTRSVSSRRR